MVNKNEGMASVSCTILQTLSEFPSKWIPFQLAIATRPYGTNNLEKGTCLRSIAIKGYVLNVNRVALKLE